MNNKGSTTIEACILVPLTFALSLLFLFSGIVFYNRSAVCYATQTALIRGSEHAESENAELAEFVKDEFLKASKDRLIFCRGDTDVKVSYSGINVDYSGSTYLPRLNIMASAQNSIDTGIDSSGKTLRSRRCRITRAVAMIRNANERKDENNDKTH